MDVSSFIEITICLSSHTHFATLRLHALVLVKDFVWTCLCECLNPRHSERVGPNHLVHLASPLTFDAHFLQNMPKICVGKFNGYS